MSRPKIYSGPRGVISPLIDMQLMADFDEYTKKFGSGNRNEEIQIAMRNHISEKMELGDKVSEVDQYKVDLCARYCEAHKIALFDGKVFSLEKDEVLGLFEIENHKVNLRLFKNDLIKDTI